GTLTSIALQYGVPLEALARKFAHQRFEPSGFTKNPEIRNASSIIDYVFRWMALTFIPDMQKNEDPNRNQPELAMPGLLEEVKKKVNRPVPELPLAEEVETGAAPSRITFPSGNGHGKSHGNGSRHAQPGAQGRELFSLSDTIAHF